MFETALILHATHVFTLAEGSRTAHATPRPPRQRGTILRTASTPLTLRMVGGGNTAAVWDFIIA